MNKNGSLVLLVLLCVCICQAIAAPKNKIKINEKNIVSVQREEVITYNTPLELIKAHNFWIGCCSGAIENYLLQEDNSCVKKLFSIQAYDDKAAITSIPNEIDFIFFADEVIESEQLLLEWYKKIRPGGMLIGTCSDTVFKNQIKEVFKDKNALIAYVNADLWYIQKKHFLSCIIPTYNRAHTLSEAIDSLYKQNLTIPFEVIVTDDASTDDTQELLNYYQQKYENFSFYVHAVNGGASKARNTCIEHARGDLIFNLDSDNYLEQKSLQRLINLLDTSGCDVAAFGTIKYFYQSRRGRKVFSHVWNFKFLHNICSFQTMFGNAHIPIGSGNYLFTKKSFEHAKGYDGRVMETWRFGYKQFATGSKMVVLPGTYYWHRLSRDGKWNSNQALNKNNPAAFKTYSQYPELIKQDKSFSHITEANFLINMEKGIIKPISTDALEHLFNAYRYEEFGLFNDAVQEYDCAIQQGACHENIYARREIAVQNQ